MKSKPEGYIRIGKAQRIGAKVRGKGEASEKKMGLPRGGGFERRTSPYTKNAKRASKKKKNNSRRPGAAASHR